MGGLKGAGALAFAEDSSHISDVLVRGGGQEHGQRAGTENVAAIAGFGAVARTVCGSFEAEAGHTRRFCDLLETAVLRIAPDAVIFGSAAERLPNTSAFAVPGMSAETLLMALDLDGVAVSSGSACSSGKVGRSHVLAAMGVEPGLASGAIRVSFGWSSTAADVHRFATAFARAVERIQRRRAA
jgi:cysteine desulfurase